MQKIPNKALIPKKKELTINSLNGRLLSIDFTEYLFNATWPNAAKRGASKASM